MISEPLDRSLRALSQALGNERSAREALSLFWGGEDATQAGGLSSALRAAAEHVDQQLATLTHSDEQLESLIEVFNDDRGAVVFHWCEATVGRNDIRIAPLLKAAAQVDYLAPRAFDVTRNRLIQGPFSDALACISLLGSTELLKPGQHEARARLEILLWEAGASARQMPELGPWLFGETDVFDTFVATPAKGSLRGRVLAARWLEVCAMGLPPTAHEMLGRTLQVLQPLLLHPEPLVSTHAARALGLLAAGTDHLQGMLMDWLGGDSLVLKQRAMTAAAVLPQSSMGALRQHVVSAINDPASESWAPAAAAAATPYLFHNHREIWNRLANLITAGRGGPSATLELAKGLAALWRRGEDRAEVAEPWSLLRNLARTAHKASLYEWRAALLTISTTDPVDGAERGPLDVESGIENLMHLAAQYDDEEADARAARFASSLARTFDEAHALALSELSARQRAAGMNSLEGCARSLALRLWHPQLTTHPRGEAIAEPDLSETWIAMAKAPTELLQLLAERRQAGHATDADAELEVLAVQLGGYVLDACSEAELGPERGPTAYETCLWLRKVEGLADASRELSSALQRVLGAVFWRLVDTTRGTALGAVDDVEWLGPFAAWWALVIDAPEMLRQLTTALPLIREEALERCTSLAQQLRETVVTESAFGAWGPAAQETLSALHAVDTELAKALGGLAGCLAKFDGVSGRTENFDALCVELVVTAERLQTALGDPVKALHATLNLGDVSYSSSPPKESVPPDNSVPPRSSAPPPYSSIPPRHSLAPHNKENALRIASLVARAVRSRDLAVLDVWFASLGPITSSLVEGALNAAKQRTPPPRRSKHSLMPESIQGYELVKKLGEGGVGKVWLVRRPGADRLFVLKVPKREALANASDTERAGILASFEEEARAMAELYHPNVCSIIDRGISGEVPFLVLELLVGADLKQYSSAQLLSLFELRQIVLDACSGLTALHSVRLVHRDIKPANIWLKLPLAKGEHFDPNKHRDPARMRPLAATVIDFGMVRPMRVDAEAAGRFVAGTPGYIAPDQVLDPVELDGRADLYALAGTIYNVTTGRAFFDDIENPRDRIFAHMKRHPLEDPSLLSGYPAELVKLMRAATALDPNDRPQLMEFARGFEAAL